MSVTIRNRAPGHDPVARAHHRRARIKTALLAVVIVSVVAGLIWLLFSSPTFAVTDVQVGGATPTINEAVRSAVEDLLGKKTLGFLQPARNIMFLDEQGIALSLHALFNEIETLSVSKSYPHTLQVQVHARVAVGTWCRKDVCQYFDVSGKRWGIAIPSRGPLLVFVQDERSDSSDERVFKGLMGAVGTLPSMGMYPRTITLQDGAPGDMRIQLSVGYDLLFDALGDMDDQLSTLSVFISDRASDPVFKPLYIDMRTPGRVYYK